MTDPIGPMLVSVNDPHFKFIWRGYINKGPLPDSDYIAGFARLDNAIEYGRRHGWPIPEWALQRKAV